MTRPDTRIPVAEIQKFLSSTHLDNLKRIRQSLNRGSWSYWLPDSWTDTEDNKNVIFHAINAHILGSR
jgi:hypothetical protein